MSIEHLTPPAKDRRSWLTGIIASLEEELQTIAPHRWNAEKIAGRERGLALYRESLRRLDAAEAESRRP
jgi:hypothetical protein